MLFGYYLEEIDSYHFYTYILAKFLMKEKCLKTSISERNSGLCWVSSLITMLLESARDWHNFTEDASRTRFLENQCHQLQRISRKGNFALAIVILADEQK